MKHLQLKQQTRSNPSIVTVYGRLKSTRFIEAPNGHRFLLSEHRNDDQGVYMYWMLKYAGCGMYEVLKRLDPRYCEQALELHNLSRDKLRNLSEQIEQTEE